MNHQNLPDCPEAQKHWSGYDPADPPTEDDEGFSPQEREENYYADLGEARFKEEDL